MVGRELSAVSNLSRGSHQFIVVLVEVGIESVCSQRAIQFISLLDESWDLSGTLNFTVLGESLLDDRGVRNVLVRFNSHRSRYDEFRFTVVDPVCELFGSEATEYH